MQIYLDIKLHTNFDIIILNSSFLLLDNIICIHSKGAKKNYLEM